MLDDGAELNRPHPWREIVAEKEGKRTATWCLLIEGKTSNFSLQGFKEDTNFNIGNKECRLFVSPLKSTGSATHNEKSFVTAIYLMGRLGFRLETWRFPGKKNPAVGSTFIWYAISLVGKHKELGGAMKLYLRMNGEPEAPFAGLPMLKNFFTPTLLMFATNIIGNHSNFVNLFFGFFRVFSKKNHNSLCHNDKKG